MISFLIGVIVVLVGTAAIFFIMWKVAEKAKSDADNKIEKLQEANNLIMGQLSKLHDELRIKNENRKEANEKVESLHNGDAVSNAINGLSKH